MHRREFSLAEESFFYYKSPNVGNGYYTARSRVPLMCHRNTRFPLVCHRIRFTAAISEVNPFHRSGRTEIFSSSTPATSGLPLEASRMPFHRRRRCAPPPAPPQSVRHLLSFDSTAPQPRPPPPSPSCPIAQASYHRSLPISLCLLGAQPHVGCLPLRLPCPLLRRNPRVILRSPC
jgi:hypothetical protein